MQAAVQAHPFLDGRTDAMLLIALIIDHLVRLVAIVIAIIVVLAMILASRKPKEEKQEREQLPLKQETALTYMPQEKHKLKVRKEKTQEVKQLPATKKEAAVVRKETPKAKVLYEVVVKESSLLNPQNILLEKAKDLSVLLLCSDNTLRIQDEYLLYNDVSSIFNKHHVQLVYEYLDQNGNAFERLECFKIKEVRKAPEVASDADGYLALRAKGVMIVE